MTARPEPAAETTGLLAALKRLGFTEYEGRIYLQLLREAPATAYEIAKATGVPRPNTYNALEALAKRGAVLPISDGPVRYVATPPERHLSRISRETTELCETLTDDLARLSTVDADPYVWNVHGEAAIERQLTQMIEDSRTHVWIKASDDVLRPIVEPLRRAAARGVDILIILYGPDPEAYRFAANCRVLLHEGNGVRMGSADNLFTLTIDHGHALTATTDKQTAFHTRNPAVVLMADTLIRHDYYMAEIHRRFGAEIDAAFGPHLRDLRLSTFSDEQIASFREKTGLGDDPRPPRADGEQQP